MIYLHRLNGQEFVLNADLIDTVECRSFETVISIVTGNRIVVTETVAQVIEKAVEYRRKIHQEGHCKPPMLNSSSDVEGSPIPAGEKGGSPCR